MTAEISTVAAEPGEPAAADPVAKAGWLGKVLNRFGAATCAFAIIATVFGAIFAVLTPPFWGHDELTQFGRAYQVAHGGVFPQRIADGRGVAYGGEIPVSVDALMDYAFRDYNDNPEEPDAMVADPGAYDRLGSASISSATKTMWFTNTAAYSPVPYVPTAIGIRVGEALGLNVGGMYLLTRLAGLVAYVSVVSFALFTLRRHRSQWIAFTIAVLPIALFQAGTVTADTLTNALAILVSALLVKSLFIGARLRPYETAAFLATAILLPLSKPTYVLLAMLIVAVPPSRLGFTGKWRLVPAAFAATGLALFLAWTKIAAPTGEGMGLMRKPEQWYQVRPGDQLKGVLSHPIDFIHTFGESIALRDHRWFNQFFGELGFAYVDVPAVSMLACLIAIAVSFGIADRFTAAAINTKRAVIVLLTLLASVAMIYVTLYMSFTPVGFYLIDGVQGRYFVPLAIVGLALVARWVPLRLTNSEGETPLKGTAIAIVSASSIALIAAAATYYTVIWG
ncbi:DUF2142 domain-containing protein [Nocardia camponoti]|uniref:DUF2142 domain-containing protein n=1 Tax=Nocardia camponoti TaxID=1616106 RepID=A0A917VF55_9NOCA|nr:DUF2142 domain-containing protein [Nocardia camponoti]GGK69376.1 hypothetical protein GCM10011591_46860 [Nocardia camponoti]